MAILVPYSVDAKKRKESQGKKISDHKDISGEKFKSKNVNANPNAYWNESHTLWVFFIYDSLNYKSFLIDF